MSDLPPLDQPQAHVVVGPNDQRGPYALELLISEVIAGRLSDETPVWWPGLPDWTTMGSHPGVAAELQRRRAPAPAPAPGWADPTAQPVDAQPAAPQPAAPQPIEAQPAGDQPASAEVYAAAQPTADPFAAPVVDAEDDIEDAVVVEDTILVTDTIVVEDGQIVAEDTVISVIEQHHVEAYSGLVARSAERAKVRERVDAVDESIVSTVIAAAADRGFELSERADVDRNHELRFDAASGDLLVISLGRVAASRVEDIRSEHLPVTVSYRSGAYDGGADAGSGEHGDVRIVADEWTGQATSTVSLLLGVDDYVSESLELDEDALALDVAATIATVQQRLV